MKCFNLVRIRRIRDGSRGKISTPKIGGGLGIGLILLSTLVQPVFAQVTVEVLQEQDQFLPGETVPAAVRITNRSGQSLKLGAEANWLNFSVESKDGGIAQKLGEVPVIGEFSLESSKMATKRVNLQPYFSLSQPRR